MDQTQNAMMQQLGGSHSYQNPMPNANSHFSASHNREAGAGVGKRHGFPPTPPFTSRSTSPQSFVPSQTVGHGGFHSRSHSQPAFFSLDSLPSLTPSSLSDSNDASVDDHDHEHDSTSHSSAPHPKPNSGLPPRKSHRRSRSDIPFGFLQSSPPLPPPPAVKLEGSWGLGFDATNGEANGEKKAEGDPGDDLFTAFLNLEGLDDEKREELDSRGSSMKTNGADSSENEGESSPNESGGSSALLWANHVENKTAFPASGTTAARHCRSLSMDSLIGKLSFVEESPKPPPSSMGRRGGQGYQANGVDSAFGKFSLEFGNGEFSAAEMKKIMSNEKLAEMAMADPKRVKRILANRQSAARSKERKMRYIAELEHKVQTLQTEATTLSAQLTLMQRDSSGLVNLNNELKFRLQAMEQQGQLRDALNEALTAEVQRLKLAAREVGDSRSSNNLPQQMSINSQMFQLQQQQQQQQQQQSAQIPFYRLQRQQQQQQNGAATNNESNE